VQQGGQPEQPETPTQAAAAVAAPESGVFGPALEPVLRRAVEQQGHGLSEVHWFRTDWQRGGAATGYATFHDDRGGHDVVVKLPIKPRERRWLRRLEAADGDAPVGPRVFADGAALNGYDLAWVVMERLPHGPLGPQWGPDAFDLLTDAAARFYRAAAGHPVEGEPPPTDWSALLERARKRASVNDVPDAPRWKKALKACGKKIKKWQHRYDTRAADDWCHGDLHLANAMTRTPPPAGPAVLIDFAETRPGHWVEDAVYLEHLFWAWPDRLGGRHLARQIAHRRKDLGLPFDPRWADVAQLMRALLAMSTLARPHTELTRNHLAAALTHLEAAV